MSAWPVRSGRTTNETTVKALPRLPDGQLPDDRIVITGSAATARGIYEWFTLEVLLSTSRLRLATDAKINLTAHTDIF